MADLSKHFDCATGRNDASVNVAIDDNRTARGNDIAPNPSEHRDCASCHVEIAVDDFAARYICAVTGAKLSSGKRSRPQRDEHEGKAAHEGATCKGLACTTSCSVTDRRRDRAEPV